MQAAGIDNGGKARQPVAWTLLPPAGWAFAHTAIASEVNPATIVSELPQFRWVNTVLGNLKTTLAGTLHALD